MPAQVEVPAITSPLGLVVDDQSLNSATPDTGWLDVRGKRSICFDCEVTDAGAATAIVTTLTHKRADRATAYKCPEIPAGGAAAPLAVTWTLSNGLLFSVPLNVEDFDYVKATFAGTGATAGDTISVYASTAI